MTLKKAFEIASKHGASTVGETILYIENHANELFSMENMVDELVELVEDASVYCDDRGVKRVNERKGPPLPQNPFGAYKRGYNDGWSDGINSVMKVVIFTLVDNEFLSDDEVIKFGERFKSILDMLDSGNMTMADVEKTMKKEYDWEVNMH